MVDNHVHIGWYTHIYNSPKGLWESEIKAGIDDIVVSSTSTCAELYKLVVREMKELIRLGGPHIHPILWLTPRMLKTWGVSYMLHSKIRWQGIKMHWKAHREWYYNPGLTKKAIEIARNLNVPILLHTGLFKECRPIVFKSLCSNNPDLSFVLAHGRPIDEMINVLKSCPNVMVDTAFMPIEDIKMLIDCGYMERILFGTDVPINNIYYKDLSTTEYVQKCLQDLKSIVTENEYKHITNKCIYNNPI